MLRASARNSAGQLLSVASGAITTLLVSVLLSRSIGPAAYGHYAYALFLVGALDLILAFGIPPTIARFLAEAVGRGDRGAGRWLFRSALTIRLSIGIAFVITAAALLGPATRLVGMAGQANTFLMVLVVLLPTAVLGLVRASFTALLRADLYARVAIPLQAARLLLYASLAYGGASVVWLVSVEGFVAASAAVLLVPRLRRELGQVPEASHAPSYTGWRTSALNYALAMTGITILDFVVWSRAEIYLIQWLRSPDEVAYYAVAIGIPSALANLLPAAITNSVMPTVARLAGAGRTDEIASLYPTMIRVLLLLLLPVSVGGALMAPDIVTVLYGAEYETAVRPMQIAFVGITVMSLLGAHAAVLYGLGVTSFGLRLAVGLAPINIGLNLVLIQQWGILGAATANLATFTLAILPTFRRVSRQTALAWPWDMTVRTLAAIGLMIAMVLIVQEVPVGASGRLVLSVWLGAATYFVGVSITGAVRAEERRDGARQIAERLSMKWGKRSAPG